MSRGTLAAERLPGEPHLSHRNAPARTGLVHAPEPDGRFSQTTQHGELTGVSSPRGQL